MSAVEDFNKVPYNEDDLYEYGIRLAERLDALEAENERLKRQLAEHDDAVGMVRALTSDNEWLRAELARVTRTIE